MYSSNIACATSYDIRQYINGDQIEDVYMEVKAPLPLSKGAINCNSSCILRHNMRTSRSNVIAAGLFYVYYPYSICNVMLIGNRMVSEKLYYTIVKPRDMLCYIVERSRGI